MNLNSSPIFIHSNIARGHFAAKMLGASIVPGMIQESVIKFLSEIASQSNSDLIFPAFNYDYGRKRVFDVRNDPVQVGALPEWVRSTQEYRRTEVPFFSFLSKIDLGIATDKLINPFGVLSGFQWLVDNDATFLLFGTDLRSFTFIHYVEEHCGELLYRYKKNFPGTIVSNGLSRSCEFEMHVRPLGVYMDYDWPRLDSELRELKIIKCFNGSPYILYLKARDILEFWGNRISDDPLYLLDSKSRAEFFSATAGCTKKVRLEEYEP